MTEPAPSAFVPRLDKSGPAVWLALDGEHRAVFEAEFRAILTEVAETFDVDRLAQVVRRWWPRAVLDAHPDPIAEHIGQRLSDGDQSVLSKTAAELRAEMVRDGRCATRSGVFRKIPPRTRPTAGRPIGGPATSGTGV